jgi:hypothetical protein
LAALALLDIAPQRLTATRLYDLKKSKNLELSALATKISRRRSVSLSATNGPITIDIVNASVQPLRIIGRPGAPEADARNIYLVLKVRITNIADKGSKAKFTSPRYSPWHSGEGASAWDERGSVLNHCQSKTPDWPRDGVVNSRILNPEESVFDYVAFAAPNAGSEEINVKLLADNLGNAKGSFQFKIDRSFVDERVAEALAPLPTWAAPKPAKTVDSRANGWSGTHTSTRGYVCDARMQIIQFPTGAVDGWIEYTLKKTPTHDVIGARQIGQKGVEFVRGIYDPRSKNLQMWGYARHDPKNILSLDQYDLKLSSDDRPKLQGKTRETGLWTGSLTLTPAYVEKE